MLDTLPYGASVNTILSGIAKLDLDDGFYNWLTPANIRRYLARYLLRHGYPLEKILYLMDIDGYKHPCTMQIIIEHWGDVILKERFYARMSVYYRQSGSASGEKIKYNFNDKFIQCPYNYRNTDILRFFGGQVRRNMETERREEGSHARNRFHESV